MAKVLRRAHRRGKRRGRRKEEKKARGADEDYGRHPARSSDRADVVGGSGRGWNRPRSEENRKWLGFGGEVTGEVLASRVRGKGGGAEEGACRSLPRHAMAGKTVRPVPADEGASATHRPPRPLHSGVKEMKHEKSNLPLVGKRNYRGTTAPSILLLTRPDRHVA
jgi:hypothetical protein